MDFHLVFFFIQSIAVLKDVPNSPHQIIKDPSQDHIRMSAYPNLEYGNLYNALAMLLDVASNIQFGLNGIVADLCLIQYFVNTLISLTFGFIYFFSIWQSCFAVFGMYFAISRQRSHR